MTDPGLHATNAAGGHAAVGLQAEVIHGDVYAYVTHPGDSAEHEYEVGVNYLAGGVPSAALARIEHAIASGHDTSEARFHWLLALVSGRTSRQFSPEDTSRLEGIRKNPVIYRYDPWAEGIRVILRLLDSLRAPDDDDSGPSISALDSLPPLQREPVLRHLAVFLEGTLGDEVWKREHAAACANQDSGQRPERVWRFFEPPPARPRAQQPRLAAISPRDSAAALGGAVAAVAALADIGWQLVVHGSVTGLVGWTAICVGCCLAARNWIDLRWEKRHQAEQTRLRAPRPHAPAPGFARSVDQRFDHYLAVRVPRGASRENWIAGTAGVRQQVRDEIVDIYREQRIGARRLDWLIRYEVEEMARQWRAGTLHSPDDEFCVSSRARITRAAGVAALTAGVLIVGQSLLHAGPLRGFLAVAVLAFGGYLAERGWTRNGMERRRAAADQARSERIFARREAAYGKWIEKLANIKPTDQEMAAWLDCDKKIILECALRRYGLKRSDVITYAFLETPGESYRRASVRNGPWRYTRYKILVFLLTRDGIRQIAYDLRTKDGFIEELDRESYGYRAIVSVQASAPATRNDDKQSFHLHLVSGRTVSFHVADPTGEWSPENGDASLLDTATQETTGLLNTLRVLEGIAADGQEWLDYEIRRQDHQRSDSDR